MIHGRCNLKCTYCFANNADAYLTNGYRPKINSIFAVNASALFMVVPSVLAWRFSNDISI